MKSFVRIISMASLIFSMEAGAADKGGKGKGKGKDDSKQAAKCDFALEANDSMQYTVGGKPIDPKAVTIEVPATCGNFTIYFSHTGKLAKTVMGHDFVLTHSKDAETIRDAAINPKFKLTDYIPNMSIEPFKSKVIAASPKMLGGGEKESIVINPKSLKNKEEYTFFCTFPGHFTMMQGKLKLLYVR